VWDELISTGAGVYSWRPGIRHHQTISQAELPERKGVAAITVSTEAFTLLSYANCIKRWKKKWEHNKGSTERNRIPKKKGEKGTLDFMCEWSDPHCGDGPFGGWKPKGIIRFHEYCALVKAGQAKKNCLELEQECLRRVRVRNNISDKNKKDKEDINEEKEQDVQALEACELAFDD
jgi:hypothetical protein